MINSTMNKGTLIQWDVKTFFIISIFQEISIFGACLILLLITYFRLTNGSIYKTKLYIDKNYSPKIVSHLRLFFASLRHAHCRTNYLGGRTRRIWHKLWLCIDWEAIWSNNHIWMVFNFNLFSFFHFPNNTIFK